MNGNGWVSTVCDVCRLVNSDLRPKLCAYCGACDSWICTDHLHNWVARAHAKVLRMLEKRGYYGHIA